MIFVLWKYWTPLPSLLKQFLIIASLPATYKMRSRLVIAYWIYWRRKNHVEGYSFKWIKVLVRKKKAFSGSLKLKKRKIDWREENRMESSKLWLLSMFENLFSNNFWTHNKVKANSLFLSLLSPLSPIIKGY